MLKRHKKNADVLAKINKKAIKYCSAKSENGEETIIGKKGAINVLQDEITIVCDGSIVFRCDLKGAKVFELMSLGGAVIESKSQSGGRITVTAYYTSP